MKKIFALLLVALLFALPVLAEDDPYEDLSDLECLARGVIRTEGLDFEAFVESLYIIDDSDMHINTDKFVYFCNIIEALYYIPITRDELFLQFAEDNPYVDTSDMDAVYTSLFSQLDKYSYYLAPDRSESFWNPMSQKGIGITLVYDPTGDAWGSVGTFVEGVARGSGAEEAGIRMGDKLVSFMGIDVSKTPFSGISSMLSAAAALDLAELELVVERQALGTTQILTYFIERRETTFREYSFHLYPEENAFMLSLDRFSSYTTASEITARMRDLKEAGYTTAILDLRDNSGGDVNVATGVIGAFLKDKKRVFTMGREGYLDYYSYYTDGGGVEFDSLYVLVNSNSASSAEITALCLKQHAGAEIVGEKTVGKAVAQSAAQLIDGSTFGVTTFVAYDNWGETYNEKGILPRYIISNEYVPYEFPSDLEWFNYINYVEAVYGAENDVVTALERRLEIMGFLTGEYVDGVWDEYTTDAVKALEFSLCLDVTGELSLDLVGHITDIINSYKTSETLIDRQLETVFQMIY